MIEQNCLDQNPQDRLILGKGTSHVVRGVQVPSTARTRPVEGWIFQLTSNFHRLPNDTI